MGVLGPVGAKQGVPGAGGGREGVLGPEGMGWGGTAEDRVSSS